MAGASKLATPAGLTRSLHEVLGLPTFRGLAQSIGLYEVTAVDLLLITPLRPIGFVMTAAAGVGILAYTLLARWRGASEPCGCFGGAAESPPAPISLVFGAALLGGALWGLSMDASPLDIDAAYQRSAVLVAALAGIAMLVAIGLNRHALVSALTRKPGG
ncbi:MauE/DoxX family redox-associated membrane protein [Blastococcus sp. Marseille-P5729]|uniref:MauE/DoxX family redox-associated membrane protein n=1 Tax=Blastococcus sp. Marseille-P5729 TaxID=2086582 RepID=UPI00351A4DC3